MGGKLDRDGNLVSDQEQGFDDIEEEHYPDDIESAIGLVLSEALAFDEALNMDGKMLRMLVGFGPTRSQQDESNRRCIGTGWPGTRWIAREL